MDKLPLVVIVKVLMKMFAHESDLFAERNYLYENNKRYRDTVKDNGAIFMRCRFSIAIILKDQFFFIFDSHSPNATDFYDYN